MTGPMNAKDLSSIEGLDKEIGKFISSIEEGKAPNPDKLLHIEKELKNLLKNKDIPDSVKQSLHSALKQLSLEESGQGGMIDLNGLYGAKMQVDQAVEQGKLQNQ